MRFLGICFPTGLDRLVLATTACALSGPAFEQSRILEADPYLPDEDEDDLPTAANAASIASSSLSQSPSFLFFVGFAADEVFASSSNFCGRWLFLTMTFK
jgi:hypothetical protein